MEQSDSSKCHNHGTNGPRGLRAGGGYITSPGEARQLNVSLYKSVKSGNAKYNFANVRDASKIWCTRYSDIL